MTRWRAGLLCTLVVLGGCGRASHASPPTSGPVTTTTVKRHGQKFCLTDPGDGNTPPSSVCKTYYPPTP